MAQQARSHAPRGEYSADFWVAKGLEEQPSTRDKFIALTIDELAKTGPHSFNATLICDLLGTTYPMVNHYFGNRDGLVAEAVATAYQRYIFGLRDAALTKSTPTERLDAWIREQLRWTIAHPGIAVVLDFPQASLEVSNVITEKYQAGMTNLFEYNMALLMQLISDIQNDRVSPLEFEVGQLPRDEIMANVALVSRASSMGLATLGAAVWLAGQHTPGTASVETQAWRDAMAESHIALLIKMASDPL